MENSIVLEKTKLIGKVKVSGAKNSALRLLAASILTEEKVEFHNFPNGLLDIQVHLDMLKLLGKRYVVNRDTVIIEESQSGITSLNWTERSIRNTLLILGALVTRFGEGKVPLPGGCKLGERKYDLHVMLLERLGAEVWEESSFLCAKVKLGSRLKGAEIFLPMRSTGATENAIICASLANGKSTIWNPHIRPEIIDLIDMMCKMGAEIKVYGQKCIVVNGVEALTSVKHIVIPDNMEALTWAIGAVITNGEVEIEDFPFQHLEVPMVYLRESGMKYYSSSKSLFVRGGEAFPIEISTGPYPGINSDMQPLFAVYGAMSKGESKVIDLRFPGRYGYAEELAKMGMKFDIRGDMLVIRGGVPLQGNLVRALDLRAGIALLLAGLTANGVTAIENSWQIHRGYENLFEKLKGLEVKI
jgi:UDP-N-acetylglucosamine 1-carboxyvinyltransferase